MQDLQVQRESFQRIESKMIKLFTYSTVVVIPLPLINYLVMRYTDLQKFYYLFGTSFWLMGIFAATLVIYNYSTLSLIKEMYYHHRLAFKQHILTQVLLFIATEVTML